MSSSSLSLSLSSLLILLLVLLVHPSAAQDTCSVGGQTFQRGDSLGDAFVQRCGPPSLYPCFCNPDVRDGIECPYCSFATNVQDLIRCARDGEEITFVDQGDVGQRCSCDASDPTNPISTCVADVTAESCQISLPDGSIIERPAGELIGRESRCGATSDYPCTCNPSVSGQIECNYCSFALQDDGLVCIGDGETKTFVDIDGFGLTCSCEFAEFPSFPMVSTCVEAPTRVPVDGESCTYTRADGTMFSVLHGTQLDLDFFTGRCGPDFPCFCNVEAENQIECPYCAVPLDDGSFLCGANNDILRGVPVDDGGGTTTDCQCSVIDASTPFEFKLEFDLECGDFPTSPPDPEPTGICEVDLPNGQTTTIVAGEPIPAKPTPCDNDSNDTPFPYVCNPDITTSADLSELPYCRFETNSGDTFCARDGTSITFFNVQNEEVTCDCAYNGFELGPQTSCFPVKQPTSPTIPPDNAPEPTMTPIDTTRDQSSATTTITSTTTTKTTMTNSMMKYLMNGTILMILFLGWTIAMAML